MAELQRDGLSSLQITLRERRGDIARGVPVVEMPGGKEVVLALEGEALAEVLRDQQTAVTRVHSTLTQVGQELTKFIPRVPEVLPTRIVGQALNPDGTVAAGIAVEALRPEYKHNGQVSTVAWPARRARTDSRGGFHLHLPTAPIPVPRHFKPSTNVVARCRS